MKILILFRGAPGCGKSTFIKNNGLDNYTVSVDKIRLMLSSPILTSDGSLAINQKNDKFAWKIVMNILENRMKNGDFTVLDSTNAKVTDFSKYKNLATKYKYRIYCIDMTNVPIETAKAQNKKRNHQVVPEYVIDRMYEQFKTPIPSGIKVIKPEDFDKIWYKPIDLSGWKKIHHIGDIHGCYTALMEMIDGELKNDELYIFTGDFLERGIENVEMIKFILQIYSLPNVILIEGNHEANLKKWANDEDSCSRLFNEKTAIELTEAGIEKKDIRQLYRSLYQCLYYIYDDKTFLVTHGGISNIPEQLIFVPTIQMINGVGNFDDYASIEETFHKNIPNVIQIHGHRNVDKSPTKINDWCYNLEGKVEYGGCLRSVTVSHDDIIVKNVKNSVYNKEQAIKHMPDAEIDKLNISSLIDVLRNSNDVQEKKFGNISSFNFSRKAFYNDTWNRKTTKARGLFIDTENNEIVCRSYDKFFNYEQILETPSLISDSKEPNGELILKRTVKFPLNVYEKIDGFLGMVSVYNDELFYTSKSSSEGPHAQLLKDVIKSIYDKKTLKLMKNYIKKNNCTFVFECVDINNDAHIIKYRKNACTLLEIVKNDNTFFCVPYEELSEIAKNMKIKFKKKRFTIVNWREFDNFKAELLSQNPFSKNGYLEGYVVEDSNGFRFKLKGNYYNFWKRARVITDSYIKGKEIDETSLLSEQNNQDLSEYIAWLKKKNQEDLPKNIIKIRDLFLSEKKE